LNKKVIDMAGSKKRFETNLRRWNELVEIHAKSREYDLEGFKAGGSSLHTIELEAFGDISRAGASSTSSATSAWIPCHGRGWAHG